MALQFVSKGKVSVRMLTHYPNYKNKCVPAHLLCIFPAPLYLSYSSLLLPSNPPSLAGGDGCELSVMTVSSYRSAQQDSTHSLCPQLGLMNTICTVKTSPAMHSKPLPAGQTEAEGEMTSQALSWDVMSKSPKNSSGTDGTDKC